MQIPKGILPAIRRIKDFEDALQTTSKYVIFLETRLSQLNQLVRHAKRCHKKVLIHFDLIQGLKADEHGMEFLIHAIKPDGVLSTRGNVIQLAKKHDLLAIQRIFLLDSIALKNNVKLVKRSQPDCIEVLPGLVPSMIQIVHEETGLPIIAGGLIREESDITTALEAGAVAVSTSERELWQ
ncbi:MAG TPA: glycerol-3-phosphate responsive antiterminator [Cerasibacillus sp.]|uniref:glycerol-3-phosphate responsive antiterminator n=1 Tax=Cerasibacillus sp. TaxID=2498711 RepID=UPI002F41948D